MLIVLIRNSQIQHELECLLVVPHNIYAMVEDPIQSLEICFNNNIRNGKYIVVWFP
jgi:formylmethanofuran dehydrogenase subunit C